MKNLIGTLFGIIVVATVCVGVTLANRTAGALLMFMAGVALGYTIVKSV